MITSFPEAKNFIPANFLSVGVIYTTRPNNLNYIINRPSIDFMID